MAINFKKFTEALVGKQKKLDVDKDGKIEASDLKKLRGEETDLEEQLAEAINADDYHATSEPSQFGGHRPVVMHKTKGTAMHTSQHRYKTKEAAAAGAKAYLNAYEKIGDRAATNAAWRHAKQHPDAIKEDVQISYSDYMEFANILSEVKKADREDDEVEGEQGEQGEQKIPYRADRKADKLGRMRPRNLRGIVVHDGEEDYKKIGEEVESIDEDDSHGVHINGRLWNVFKTKSHAQNVANKIKGATVHKYDAKELQRQTYEKSVARNYARRKDVDESVELGEGSVPKEKQKTPYRDINSAEYRAAADKQKERMDKDKAAELGKKMLTKQRVSEDYDESDLHPDAQKVLKHIKPEHHAKYTPDLTKKHYTGNYADRSAVLSAAERAGHLKEDTDLHPAAQQVLKHIKPEHHAKYTPDLTKKHYTGSYADRRDVLSAAERAGHMKEEVSSDLHPDAQKILKHIKPEHHAKYTPDMTKKTFTGSYADRTAVLDAAKRAGHLKESNSESLKFTFNDLLNKISTK